jgi:RimJ/RimL family protein N-acetyltransferase
MSETPPAPLPTFVLQTARLTLAHLRPDADASFILALLNDPDFIQNIADRGVRTVDDARQYIANGPAASYAQHGFGLYRVQFTATGESIGLCGLVRRAGLDDVDLGYAFLPEFRGKGYAVEAATAVRHHAHHSLHLPRIVAITDPTNTPSIRVLLKIGFTYEKKVRLTPDDIELNLYASQSIK